jgi:hypothetical protein
MLGWSIKHEITAGDFDLYTDPGADMAAIDIENQLTTAAGRVKAGAVSSEEAWDQIVEPVLKKYSEYGATDTAAKEAIGRIYDKMVGAAQEQRDPASYHVYQIVRIVDPGNTIALQGGQWDGLVAEVHVVGSPITGGDVKVRVEYDQPRHAGEEIFVSADMLEAIV